MDNGLATLISGVFSGLIGAAIGGFSAFLSYRLARKQVDREITENERNRTHELKQLAIPKRLEAAECVWRVLFTLENGLDFNQRDQDDFVVAQMWLPEELRKGCLLLYQKWMHRRDDPEIKSLLNECRRKLIEITGLNQ